MAADLNKACLCLVMRRTAVAQFSFPLLEIPASKPKFIERLEDDYIVREPRKDQPQAAKTEASSGSPACAESKPISDGHNGQSAVTNPADQAQEERCSLAGNSICRLLSVTH